VILAQAGEDAYGPRKLAHSSGKNTRRRNVWCLDAKVIISAARDRTALDTLTEQLLNTETLDGSVVRQAIEGTRLGRELTMRLNDEIASRLEEAAR
jgi:hypothetical protein